QSKMAEVVSGAVPLSSPVSDAQLDEDPNWTWSLQAEQDSNTSLLWDVKVIVSRPRANGSKIQASLSQKVLDPSQRGSATDAAVTASSSASRQTGSNSSPRKSSKAGSQASTTTAAGGMARGSHPRNRTPS